MKIPQKKIKGLRLGQLIYNALMRSERYPEPKQLLSRLFFIENKELQKIINEYLNDNER